jgi:predicted nucleic acid-binding protein
MTRVFADSSYWIALLNRNDQSHAAAVAAKNTIATASLVTTDEVLTEFLNFFCKEGSQLRALVAQTVLEIRADARVTVVAQSRKSFDDALDLYRKRPDKTYSLTDCRSFVLMQQETITEALTADKHFVQEGFVAILAESS